MIALPFCISLILFRSVLLTGVISPYLFRSCYIIDPLSSLILTMTFILCVFIVYAIQPQILLITTILSLLLVLCAIMSTTSVIIFYLWFEFSLLPIVALILG